MDYKKKIEYANKIALEILNNKSIESIKADLKSEGLYERDITSIYVSAKKIVGENYSKQIRDFLLTDKDFEQSQEFASLDREMLISLIKDEKQKLALEERKKMTSMIKDGHSNEEILSKVDNRFLSQEKVFEKLAKLEQVKYQNSGSGRMLNIGGGIVLIALTGIILVGTGRLFYVLPIIGLVMIVKGFMTKRMDCED
jgi:hypothetical protein